MSQHDAWNPEDGPPPTEDELSAAAELRDVLDQSSKLAHLAAESDEPLSVTAAVVLRARATVKPSPPELQKLSAGAVRDALDQANWHKKLLRPLWLVAVAGLVLGLGGLQFLGLHGTPSTQARVGPLTATAEDLFPSALDTRVGSNAMERLTNARARSFRDRALFARVMGANR